MKSQNRLILLLATVLFLAASVYAKDGPGSKKVKKLSKVSGIPTETVVDANNFTSYPDYDGLFPAVVAGSWNGEFPKGSGIGVIFQEGIVFGGLVRDGLTPSLRVGGSTYPTGMRGGKILSDAGGNTTGAEDPSMADVRIFRIRPDVRPGQEQLPDLTADVAATLQIPISQVNSGQVQSLADQYMTDWTEWPAAKGAPWYVDSIKVVRNDAGYDPNNTHHIPGIPGASQTVWFVCNDIDAGPVGLLYGSPPIGIEEQMTLWSYATSTPLNNIVFKQVKLIYKGTPTTPSSATIDSMYVVQWADPDNGDSGDDLAGCDSTLSLGYCYNGYTIDAKYNALGMPAPASGYCFLQGPSRFTGNPADSAVVNLQWRHGYAYWHPLALTAFDYFAAGSPINDPTLGGDYGGTQQFYNLMRGDLPLPAYPAGQPFYSASTYATAHGIVTSYALSGDPVSRQGWIDGLDLGPGDRRTVSVSGPFSMTRGDSVEIVVALIGGMGSDNISSVQVLKYNTTFAHYAYNQLFNLPAPPPAPSVKVANLPNKLVLDWSWQLSGSNSVSTIENWNDKGYKFQGYNVYQLPSVSAQLSQATRVGTFDLSDGITTIMDTLADPKSGALVFVPVQFGKDTKINRTIEITKDYIRQQPLVNGQSYYFAVTAYAYNPEGIAGLKTLESAPILFIGIPQQAPPGEVVQSDYGTTISYTHTTGTSTVNVVPTVVNPDLLTGDDYQISFVAQDSVIMPGNAYDADFNVVATVAKVPNTKWILTDVTKGKQLWTGTFLGADFPTAKFLPDTAAALDSVKVGGVSFAFNSGVDAAIIDGIQWKLSGIPWYLWGATPEVNRVSYVPSGNRNIAGVNWGGSVFGGGLDIGPNFWGSSLTNEQCLRNIKIVFSNDAAKQQHGFFYLRGGSPNYMYEGYGTFPGMVYDVTDPAHPRQVNIAVVEQSGSPVQDMKWDPSTSSGDREYLFVLNSTYDGTQPDVSGTLHPDYTTMRIYYDASSMDILYAMWVVKNEASRPLFVEGDNMFIYANIPPVLSPAAGADLYSISTASAKNLYNVTDSAIATVSKINVFPNPYYGWQYRETNALNKWVTISHLPPIADIKIFNLAGVLVREIHKNDASQFAQWDLRNTSALPVASGIYIIYIDMPNLGKTKILKLALVQQEQVLPTY